MQITFGHDQCLSLLVHARSKMGKSTLSATAPHPILTLDAEGSWRFIRLRKTYWDPNTGPPPQYDGTWDVCIVTVREWSTIELTYQWLYQTQTCFTSVVLDSLTEIQRRCRANMRGTEQMRIQDWGTLLTVMDKVIRGFRDLTLMATSSVRCVVFIAETKTDKHNRLVPSMQGQIADSLPYWVDICGYLYPDWETDANGQPTVEVRRLRIGPHQSYECGERVGGVLGQDVTIIRRPDLSAGTHITDWMCAIHGITTSTEGTSHV